ncbi:polysaccharide deacetylase family protein [Telmatospirillum siberiense]|uniref:Chitooligosaccharide deacetylase n=1 Tax=Telmatospirillum siberiense TaxID=382514 RepID=A0A2N3PSS3_9PROT|nr:polysaccharide deacetylase family protein [Telmatospirillum siberiense]PKU23434.1 polysaccharide deacetylase [Telmatospirillum siberiense]
MPTWISRGLLSAAFCALCADVAGADVITRLPTDEPVVALTFDACETRTPTLLDRKISDYLVREKIPFTIFVSGRFARHNAESLAALSHLDFVEIENHSLNHDNHMDRLDDLAIRREVEENDALLAGITGRHSRYFRFPAGNVSPRSLKDVEDLGYKVVHWSFPSGDPVRDLTPSALTRWVLAKTRPGSILIFHINGRGWSTGEALPAIVEQLRGHGFRFTRLDAQLP